MSAPPPDNFLSRTVHSLRQHRAAALDVRLVLTIDAEPWGELKKHHAQFVDAAQWLERLIERLKEEGRLAPGDQTVVFYGRTPDHETMRLVGLRPIR